MTNEFDVYLVLWGCFNLFVMCGLAFVGVFNVWVF